MPTFAQLGFSSADVPSLPFPGLFERLVLTSPLPTAGVLLIVGVVAMVLLRRSGSASAARGGLAVLAAAVVAALGVILAGYLVETPRERIIALTDRLVDAATTGEMPTLESMLAPGCTLTLGSGPIMGRDAILTRVRSVGPKMIASHRTGQHQGVIDTPAAGSPDNISAGRTQVRVWATGKDAMYNAASGSTWLLYWQQEGANAPWKVVGIECLQIDGMRPDMLR